MAAGLRFQVVKEAFKRGPVYVDMPKERPSEYFAKYVFDRRKMYKYLPSRVYEQMCDVIDNGAPFDRSIADAVASGIKQWAIERCDPLYPLVPASYRRHSAEARWFC